MLRSYRTISLRQLPSHENVRSTFHRRLNLRSGRPSCVGFLRRPLRCGQISSMPRSARRFRKGSESYARSVIRRLGLRLGAPGPHRGTAMFSSVFSTSLTSAGDAESRWFPKGIPLPSTTTIHFVPLPRLVFPTYWPLFLQGQNCHLQMPRSSLIVPAGRVRKEKLSMR